MSDYEDSVEEDWEDIIQQRRSDRSSSSSSSSSSGPTSSLPSTNSSLPNNKSGTQKTSSRFLTETLLTGLNRLRQQDRFCDVILKVNDDNIPAHKNILSAYSSYFNIMFTGDFKEKNDNTIYLEGIDSDSLKLIINFLYTGDLRLNKDNVQNILGTAHFLQIDPAQKLCFKFLSNDIDENNCLEFITIAGKYGSEVLLRVAIKKFVENFFKLYGKIELSNIEIYELKKILERKQLKLYPQNYVFDLIIRWIEKDYDQRIKYLNDLLCEYIDAGQITKEQLDKTKILFESNSITTSSSTTADTVEVIKNDNDKNEKINNNSIDCKQWLKDFENNQEYLKQYIYTFNHLGKFRCTVYDLADKSRINHVRNWQKLNSGASYVSYNNGIYAHGGWKSKSNYVTDAFCYNVYNDKWMKFIPMKIARAYHRTCILNDYLYIIGGGYTTRSINHVETVDLKFGTTMMVNGLIKERSWMGVDTYANSIYAVAGINGAQNLKTAERFDPREGKWYELPNNCYNCGKCSCVVIDDMMYCTMGPGKSMERFDFRMNQWILIKTQQDKYPNELFKIDNKLHGVFYDNIAEYNSINGLWNIYLQIRSYKHSNYTLAIPFRLPNL